MKIRSLSVDGFGALHGRSFDVDTGIVVVCGRNERGKSSFRSAIRTLLFGFSPASFDKHPLANLDAAVRDPGASLDAPTTRIGGSLELDEPGERRWYVQRAFAPHAVQRFHRDGDEAPPLARGNTPIPSLGDVNGALFDAVFSIDGGDARTGHRVGAGIERLLLGDEGAPDGASLTALRKELEAERGKLWRRSRRAASTRVATLDVAITRAAQEAREARAVERGLVELERELLSRGDALARRREEHASLEDELARLRLIERVARVVRSADALDGVDLDQLEALDPESPGPLLAELEDAEVALEEPRRRLARPLPPFDDRDRATLARASKIEVLTRAEREVERWTRSAESALARAAECRRGARELERATFVDAERAPDAAALRQMLVEAERWAVRRDDARAVADPGRPGRVDREVRRAGIVSTVSGALLGGAALALDSIALAAAGATLVPLGMTLALRARTGPAAAAAGAEELPMPRALGQRLRASGVDADLARSPEQVRALVERLLRSSTLREEADEGEARAAELRDRILAVRSGWGDLARSLGVSAESEADPEIDDTPDRLRARLAEARRRGEIAGLDATERQRAERELGRCERRLADVSARFDALRDGLHRVVPDEPALERAHARATRALAERERQRGALRELARDPAWHAALDDPRMARARHDGSLDLAALRASEARVDASSSAIEAERETIARMQERLERERPARTPSEVDSEIEALAADRRAAVDQHDRLALLSAVLDVAERRHRAKHQPRVLARASAWMSGITEGRYPRIGFEGGDGPGLVLDRAGPERADDGTTSVASPVGPTQSRGVREQAHLCIRLAAAEQLDVAGETLPILLDEALVHWDESRRAALYPVLARMRGRRQLFLFTCHESLADEAVGALEAQRIDL